MSDEEQPPEAEPSSDAAADAPTAPAAVVPPAEPAAAPRAPRASIEVPRWLAAVVAAVVLVGIGFAIGWFAAPGGGSGPVTIQAPFRRGGTGAGGPFGGFVRPSGGGYLGVQIAATTGSPSGVSVVGVASGSPAAAAGLQAGDVITAVNGSPVTSPAQLQQAIASHKAGDMVTVTYTRSGTSSQATVTLGSRPATTPQVPTPPTTSG